MDDMRRTLAYSWNAHLVLLPLEKIMSIVKWIAALLFAAHLPLHAEVLTVHTDATGIITALNNQFPELGYGLPSNIPVTANVARWPPECPGQWPDQIARRPWAGQRERD